MHSILSLIYVAVGISTALTHGYPLIFTSLSELASFILAVALWPAVLLGISFHLQLGF